MPALPLLPKESPKDADHQLAQDLCSLQIPDDIQLSPNGGHKVLYSTALDWGHSPEKTPLSTLWLAITGRQDSSRKLTSGRFHDIHPRWSPDGSLIAFISDREKAGESKAIYTITMVEGGGDPSPLTDVANQGDFESFAFSPDGKEILFFSPDEKPEEKKKAEDDEVSGPQVWGEDWEFARLRIVNVHTKEVRSLTDDLPRHILAAQWSPDGTQIVFTHAANPNIEEQYLSGLTISVLDVATHAVRDLHTLATELDDLHWSPTDGLLYFYAPAPLHNVYGSKSIYTLDPRTASPQPVKVAYGVTNEAEGLRLAADRAFVNIGEGIKTQIRELASDAILLERACKIDAWDATIRTSSVSAFATPEVVLAICASDVNSPDEVYTAVAGETPVRLSSHGAEVRKRKPFGSWELLTCPSTDGEVTLDALFFTPETPKVPVDEPQPTFVMIHGGPEDRNCPGFNSYYFHWAPYILDRGYSVLMPQYRGTSGRGEAFGMWSVGGVGKYDHADVVACTDAAIREGKVDPERVMVGGWSQGGFLSYLCSTRNGLQDTTLGLGKWKFQAAIPGAGVCDTDTLALTSDVGGSMEPMLNNARGHAMWDMRRDDVSNRNSSALWEVKHAVDESARRGEMVIPPMLILHGEKDERCPLSQAQGFRRALRAHGLPHEFVVYPRQEHILQEQRARVDMLERIGKWADKYIGSDRRKA